MTKAWLDIKTQFSLSNKQHYFWIQLINAIPKSWKEELHKSNRISDALSVYDHHLIKRNQICYLDKCSSNYIYNADWARGRALFEVTKSDLLENNQYQA